MITLQRAPIKANDKNDRRNSGGTLRQKETKNALKTGNIIEHHRKLFITREEVPPTLFFFEGSLGISVDPPCSPR